MDVRAMGPGAGWRWLVQGINLGRNNPKALFGAAALLLVMALVPTVVQLVVQNGLKITSPQVMYVLVAFSLLYALVVMPPLTGGFLRVIHAVETGAPTRAGAIFDFYRNGADAWRMIGLQWLLLLAAVVVSGAILLAFGGKFLTELGALFSAIQSAPAGKPPVLPPMPQGFGMLIGLFVLLALFFNAVQAIAYGQVALTRRSVGGAIADGALGALKNLLPLLVLLLAGFALTLVAIVIMALLVGLLVVLGSLVSPALGALLAAPVYLAFLLILYVVMFGVMYHLWRDVCGEPAALPDGHVEL